MFFKLTHGDPCVSSIKREAYSILAVLKKFDRYVYGQKILYKSHLHILFNVCIGDNPQLIL